jgi:predicted nucleic acid-binding protein
VSESTPIVVDSSVAVKWFVSDGEDGVEEAATLLEDHREGRCVLTAPSHLVFEVLNALRWRGLGAADLADAARSLLGMRLDLRQPESLAVRAAEVAVGYGLTVYDAAFASLALDLDAVLVTADRRLAESCACRIRMLSNA